MTKIAGLLAAALGVIAVPAVALLALIAMTGNAIACTPDASTLAADAPVPAAARLWIALTHAACPDLPEPWIAALMAQESGFRPDARRPAAGDATTGTRGLFQLDADAWQTEHGTGWDADLNHNGTPDIEDPEIHASVAGKFLCARLHDVRRQRAAHPSWSSTGELSELDAVAVARDAGESSLRGSTGLPAGTAGLLAAVRGRTTAWTATTRTPAATVDAECRDSLAATAAIVVPPGTPRGVAQAVTTALSHVGERYGWRNRCDRLACRAYGFANSGYPTATGHWQAMLATGHAHIADRCPPVGAFAYWASSQPAGHVALVVQSDPVCDPDQINLVSNDVLDSRTGNIGGVYLVTLAQIEAGFLTPAGYRGWSDPVCAGAPLPPPD